MMSIFLKKHLFALIGLGLGSVAGFLYWQEIGCLSGTCLITSTWHNSTLYGTLMGYLVGSMFDKKG